MTEEISKKNSPLVTIVLQTYNRRNLVPCALESAKNQTYKNIEILVGDNHSIDGTEEYFQEQLKLDSRIRYYRHSENIGMVGNANFLLDRVEGEYFIFLNDDDWLDLDYVEKSIEYLHGKDDYSMVCPSTLLYINRNSTDSKLNIKKCKVVKLNSKSVFKRIFTYVKYQDQIEMSTGCFRTSILRDIKKAEGQYIVDRYNEDIILEMKFLVAGKCKVLSKTHLNKREGGYSRDLLTCDKVYTTEGVTKRNLARKRCEIFSQAIKNDKYFLDLLGEKKACVLSWQVYFALESFYNIGIFLYKKLLNKLKRTLMLTYNYRLY